jgi:hypothetical protein
MRMLILLITLWFSSVSFAKIKWEKVSEGLPNGVKDVIYRAEVPHGWLLVYAKKSYRFANETIDFGSISFYPDENHDWTLE